MVLGCLENLLSWLAFFTKAGIKMREEKEYKSVGMMFPFLAAIIDKGTRSSLQAASRTTHVLCNDCLCSNVLSRIRSKSNNITVRKLSATMRFSNPLHWTYLIIWNNEIFSHRNFMCSVTLPNMSNDLKMYHFLTYHMSISGLLEYDSVEELQKTTLLPWK